MNNLKRKIPVNIQDIFIFGWLSRKQWQNESKKKKKKCVALKKEKEKRDVLEI